MSHEPIDPEAFFREKDEADAHVGANGASLPNDYATGDVWGRSERASNGAAPAANDTAEPSPSQWEALITPAPSAWFTDAPTARAWLLRDRRREDAAGLLPRGKVGMLIGAGGASKTMAMCQLSISVATGTPWLGSFDVALASGDGKARSGRVLLVLGEEDADECHRRLFRSRRAVGAPIPEEGRIVVLPLAGVTCQMLERDERRNLTDAPFLPWLLAYVEAHGLWDLIVVDPLSRFGGPDCEIDNAAATRFVQALESIAKLTGATVLVLHHTNKLARRGGAVEAVAGRGSSALVDGARWQCSLGSERLTLDDPDAHKRLGELVTWSHTKSNYSVLADDLLLRKDPENGGALVPLDETDLAIVQAARGRSPESQAKEAARETQRNTRDAAEDAAVLRIVGDRPGIAFRDLATAVQATARCSRDRAYVAVQRVADRLDVREGPRKSRLHYPRANT